jgi:hypothetical protein
MEGTYVDPNLMPVEEIGEERTFEIELDEDENEIVFVHHYRIAFGDGFDADIEHGFDIDDARSIVSVMLGMIDEIQAKLNKEKEEAIANSGLEKSTPEPIEGNPIKGSKNVG